MDDDDSTVQGLIVLGDVVVERRVAQQYHRRYLASWVDETTLEAVVTMLRLRRIEIAFSEGIIGEYIVIAMLLVFEPSLSKR